MLCVWCGWSGTCRSSSGVERSGRGRTRVSAWAAAPPAEPRSRDTSWASARTSWVRTHTWTCNYSSLEWPPDDRWGRIDPKQGLTSPLCDCVQNKWFHLSSQSGSMEMSRRFKPPLCGCHAIAISFMRNPNNSCLTSLCLLHGPSASSSGTSEADDMLYCTVLYVRLVVRLACQWSGPSQTGP